MIARDDWDFLERFLDMSVTMDVLKNASKTSRLKFHESMLALKDGASGSDYIYQQYNQSGIEDIMLNNGVWETLDGEPMIKAIETDNGEELRLLIADIKGMSKISTSRNLILKAIECGSLSCLQELMKKFSSGLRDSLQGESSE